MNGPVRLPQTPIYVIYLVVLTLSSLAVIGTIGLAGTLYFKNYADPAILTAFISIINVSIGAIAGILSNTRQQPEPEPPNNKPKNEIERSNRKNIRKTHR